MASFMVLFLFDMVSTWVVSVLTVSLSSLFSNCKVSICDCVYSRLAFSSFMSACSISRIESLLLMESSTLTLIVVVPSSVSVDQSRHGCFCGGLMTHRL